MPSNLVVPILIALLGGGLLTALWQIWLYHKRGRIEEEDLVSKVSNQVIAGAQGLLNEYRVELEAANRLVEQHLSQLSDLNRLLGEANGRIARLEQDLEKSHTDSTNLHRELQEVRLRRDDLAKELAAVENRVTEVEQSNGHDHAS